MQLITRKGYQEYLEKHDVQLLSQFQAYPKVFDAFESQRCHVQDSRKRYVFYELYRPLLCQKQPDLRVLDVGAGLTAMSAPLSNACQYLIIDSAILPESLPTGTQVPDSRVMLCHTDWDSYPKLWNHDIVIANDLFPNVDQRLTQFLVQYLPVCRELWLSLTMYDNNRVYRVQRLDAPEQLTVLAWDTQRMHQVLEQLDNRIIHHSVLSNIVVEDLMDIPDEETIFANQRKVVIVRLRGDRY